MGHPPPGAEPVIAAGAPPGAGTADLIPVTDGAPERQARRFALDRAQLHLA
jgi:hypothetical protein